MEGEDGDWVVPETLNLDGVDLIDVLGRGGEGEVFEARQLSLGRTVAIKRVRPDRNTSASQARLIAEAKTTAELEHPNVVPIYDLRDREGVPFVLMKRVQGTSWATEIHSGDLEGTDHVEVALRVCDAVAFAHARGILHLDLKPANVILGAFGQVYVADWGVATRIGESHRHVRSVGTPVYMAPEMLDPQGQPGIDRYSDVYLIAASLYHCFEGHPPHYQPHADESLEDRIRASHPEFSERTPPAMAAILRTAMSRKPEDRHTSVQELKQALVRFTKVRGAWELAARADALVSKHREAEAADQREALYLRARTMLEEALTIAPELRSAEESLRDLLVRMVEAEVSANNFEKAVSLAKSSPVVPRAVRERASAALEHERKRLSEHRRLTELAKQHDRKAARHTIASLGTFLVLFVVLPHLPSVLYEFESITWRAASVIGSEALILGLGYWRYWKEIRANRWVQHLFSVLLLIVTASFAAVSVGHMTGAPEETTILFLVFAITFVLSTFALLFDPWLLLSAVIYFGFSIISLATTEGIAAIFAIARDLSLVGASVLLLRHVGKPSPEELSKALETER